MEEKAKLRMGSLGILSAQITLNIYFWGADVPVLLISIAVGVCWILFLSKKCRKMRWSGWGNQLVSLLVGGVIGIVIFNLAKGETGE